MGADANGYTTNDYTCFHLALSTPDLPKVIEIEADRFQNLSYQEPDFQTEAGAVYGEYRKNKTQPFSALNEALANKAYDVHTYKHTTIGFEKDIAAMPTMYDYSKSFFQRFYRPENVVLVVAGDFDTTKTLALIRQSYAGWKPGYVAPKVQAEHPHRGMRTLEVPYPGRSLPIVVYGWQGMAFDPNSVEMAATMLLGDLAFGETSEIYRDLVLDRHKVQRLGSNFDSSRDPGLLTVSATVAKEEDVDAVRQAIVAAVKRYQDTPPDAKRLEDLKKRSRYGLILGLDTPDHVAGTLADYVALSGGIESVDQIYAAMDKVTPADVQAAAKKFLQDDRLTIATLKGVRS
jgi:zinc protease